MLIPVPTVAGKCRHAISKACATCLPLSLGGLLKSHGIVVGVDLQQDSLGRMSEEEGSEAGKQPCCVCETLVSPAGLLPLQAELSYTANKGALHRQRETRTCYTRDSASGKLIQVIILIL